MFARFREPQPQTAERFPSAARLAAQENLTFAEAIDKMQRQGMISGDDPRTHLDPVRVRELSSRRMSELMQDFQGVAKNQHANGIDVGTRSRYAAIVKAGSEHLKVLDDPAHGRADLAARAELMAFRMAKSDPRDPAAKELLSIAAAATNSDGRERAMRGFETNNISQAAKVQGRDWISVRDDLARHGVLPEKDPRRKIRVADIDGQKNSITKNSNTLEPEQLEDVAMRRLKSNPSDETGLSWLSAAGSICADRAPKKAAEIAPPTTQGRLFRSAYAAKRKAAGHEIE